MDDREQIERHGLTLAEVDRQLALLRDPPPPPAVHRPCTVGDGIRRIDDDLGRELLRESDEVVAAGRVCKFVPASGAASRMFQQWQRWLADPESIDPERVGSDLERMPFMSEIESLAVKRSASWAVSQAERLDLQSVLERIRFILSAEGAGFAARPKGLIPFHAYGNEVRTPFEEHLIEGAEQIRSGDGRCRIHFTISPDHQRHFESLLGDIRAAVESRSSCRLEVAFSSQDPSTDTIAAAVDGEPFRLEDGRLLFRPGGHGALIDNLQSLESDAVVIKNIDNVTTDDRRETTHRWKRILIALATRLQRRVFACLDSFDRVRAIEVLRDDFGIDFADRSDEQIFDRLDRPIRVCGVVLHAGEPGGGPYWAEDGEGVVTPQIIEGAQLDALPEGRRAWPSAPTHFNPVDIVALLRDHRGRPFDLSRFVDERAVFVAKKSLAGRDLLALERPGLWNGAMSGWNTVFVEVPSETFTPVKTAEDLLREEHIPRT